MDYIKDRFVNPLSDFGFKKIFGTEPNKDLLVHFLNEVMPTRLRIKELQFANSEHLGNSRVDRKAVFDLYCVADTGERFIVELQKVKQKYFKDRSLYYSSFPIQEQAIKGGEWNFKMAPVYTIAILDFTFTDHLDNPNFYHLVELKTEDCKVFSDKLKFVYIELPKFKKQADELETDQDRWLYVLRHLAELEEVPDHLTEGIFSKLFEVAEIANFSRDEQSAYQSSMKNYRDWNNSLETALEEGIEKGIKRGIEQGIEQGLEQVALRMLRAGANIETIAQATGLPVESIQKLG